MIISHFKYFFFAYGIENLLSIKNPTSNERIIYYMCHSYAYDN